MRTLSAGVCTLEPLVEAHAPEMFVVLTDPAIYEFEGEPPPSLELLAAGFRRRESRLTRDGSQPILDWAVRLPDGQLAGYVQATLYRTGAAYVAYEFSSKYWRRGIGSAAVSRMLSELKDAYEISRFVAVLKTANFRSVGLLRKLGFTPGSTEDAVTYEALPDEIVLARSA
jgi:RimJ/RimL family protein N-acetyltransferase